MSQSSQDMRSAPVVKGDSDESPSALGQLLAAECEDASVRSMSAGISRAVYVHLPISLLEDARARTGLASDEEVVQAALVHLVLTDPGRYA